MKRKMLGFSLVELMISLIAVSCILAAISPIVVKKMKTSGVSVNVGGLKNLTMDCTSTFTSDCILCESTKRCIVCNLSCDDGYYKDTDSCSCKSCSSINSNCNKCSSSSVCTSCNDGYYLSSSSACETCPEGSYCINGNKTPCPAGYYASSTGLSSCTSCSAGTYASNTGSTSCTSCSAGYYASNTGSSSCTACPKGTYASDTGNTSCTSCESGYYTDTTGSSSCSSCSSKTSNCSTCNSTTGTCTSCNSGYLLSSSSCSSCPAGSSCDGTTSTTCSAGYYAASGSSSCSSCSAGYYSNAGASSCTSCSAGTYSNSTASTSCTSCSAGTYASSTGATSCTSCAKGKYASGTGNTSCTSCPAGTYASSTGSSSCTSCATGYYSTTTGKTSACTTKCSSKTSNCSTCTASTGTCTSCDDGYELSDGSCVEAEWCSPTNGLVKVGSLCVTQYNIGDHDNYPIPSAAGVTIRNAASSSAGNTGATSCSTPQCWQATDSVSTTGDCDSDNGSYSGCNRIACNWCAATAICDNLSITIKGITYSDWRTPTSSELLSFDPDTYSINLGDNGLMLCDYYSGYSSANCSPVSNCYGGRANGCYLYQVWSSDVAGDGTRAWYYKLSKGSWSHVGSFQQSALSVRCVTDYN